jgi:hypothetical protein
MQEAVKKGRIGVQDAAKVADLPPEQQKAIAASPKPRRAANVAIEAAKNATMRSASGEGDTRTALRKAWEKAPPCAAYGKPPMTVRGNGLRRWFGSISTGPITESRALMNPWTNLRTRNKGEAVG